MSAKDDHYTGVLLEDINHKIDFILEAHAALAPVPGQIQIIHKRLGILESDMKTVKAVVTETNHELKQHTARLDDHARRLTTLKSRRP